MISVIGQVTHIYNIHVTVDDKGFDLVEYSSLYKIFMKFRD